MNSSSRDRQRSQSMVEFSLVAPIILLLSFGSVDLGRAIYTQVAIDEAASEGGRAAIHYSAPLPTDATVAAAAKEYAVNLDLATSCPNGPMTGTLPPPNVGWIFITDPSAGSHVETTQPLPMNAPGGQGSAPAANGCSAVNPAAGNAQLAITIQYQLVPLTPGISQLFAGHIVLTATEIVRTEY